MAKSMSLDEAREELAYKARSLVLKSDRAGLRKLYAELCAAAIMGEGPAVRTAMREALQDAVLETALQVRRGKFR